MSKTTLMEEYYSACCDGDLDKVKKCVGQGVDINGEYVGMHPFRIACTNNHRKIVEFLIGQNADVAISSAFNMTGLMGACRNGNLEIAELLLAQNSSLNFIRQQTNYTHSTALLYAAEYGHEDCVRLLLFYDPSDDHIMIKGMSRGSAIDYAKTEVTDTIKELLKSPAQLSMVGTKRAKSAAQIW